MTVHCPLLFFGYYHHERLLSALSNLNDVLKIIFHHKRVHASYNQSMIFHELKEYQNYVLIENLCLHFGHS